MTDADKLKRDVRTVLNSPQLQLQALEAARLMGEMVEDLKRKGYTWSPERGCYVHPDGSECWIEG